jgi:hypothetical protein
MQDKGTLGFGEVFDNNDDQFLASTNIVSLVLVILSIPCTIIVLCCLLYRYFKERHKYARKYITHRQLWKYLTMYCTLMLIGSDLLFEIAYVPSRAALYVHNTIQNSTIQVGLIASTEAAEMFVLTSGTWSLLMMVAIVATTRYMYDENTYKSHMTKWKWCFAFVAWGIPLICAIARIIVNVKCQVTGSFKSRYLSGLISDGVMSTTYGVVILLIFIMRISIATKFNLEESDTSPMQHLEKHKAKKTYTQVAAYVYPFVISTLCLIITRSWFDIDMLYRLTAINFNYDILNVDPNDYERILYGTSCVLLPLRGIINACVYFFVDKNVRKSVKNIIARSQHETMNLISSPTHAEEFDEKCNKKLSINSFLSELDGGMIRSPDVLSDDESTALLTPLRTPTKLARTSSRSPKPKS